VINGIRLEQIYDAIPQKRIEQATALPCKAGIYVQSIPNCAAALLVGITESDAVDGVRPGHIRKGNGR